MVRAWYMDDDTVTDKREPHMPDPVKFVDLSSLNSLGVNYWQIDADNYQQDETLAKIRKDYNYDYEDQVTCSREKLPNYDEMLAKFYQEHIHSDDETRLVVNGSGYFDIRDPRTDSWIRIEVVKNDMISIPPGLYHRFTLDTKNCITANRYFAGNPCWIALNRPQDDHPSRLQYLKKYAPEVTGAA